jgi:hypothetical protein
MASLASSSFSNWTKPRPVLWPLTSTTTLTERTLPKVLKASWRALLSMDLSRPLTTMLLLTPELEQIEVVEVSKKEKEKRKKALKHAE